MAYLTFCSCGESVSDRDILIDMAMTHMIFCVMG